MKSPLNTSAAATLGKPTEIKYQHYQCARQSMKMITPKGKKIAFVNFQFITCDQDCIDYLNEAINRGVRSITKGKLMTREEANPMSALKAEWKKEWEAEQAEKRTKDALGVMPDMGSTAKKGSSDTKQPLGAASTKHVANGASSSSSK